MTVVPDAAWLSDHFTLTIGPQDSTSMTAQQAEQVVLTAEPNTQIEEATFAELHNSMGIPNTAQKPPVWLVVTAPPANYPVGTTSAGPIYAQYDVWVVDPSSGTWTEQNLLP
jgi:hypothetical protein